MIGAINVLKPTGWTSSDVVVRVKHIIRQLTGDRSVKVGHLGTLDPAGSGVLPIVFGRATRLFDYYVDGDKLYRATFTFGIETDTLDSYGTVTATCDILPTVSDIRAVIGDFIGDIEQVPPQYSRISVDGSRACDIARRGGVADIKARHVKVHSIDILSYEYGVLTVDISCSGGTYVRSICRDIAHRLDTVAYMSTIIRLENKGFYIEDSVTLDELEEDFYSHIISLEELLSSLRQVMLSGEEAKSLMNGVPVLARNIEDDYAVLIDGKIYGICCDAEDRIKVLIRLWQ